jgi:DNA-binding NarL/FixJ family response regulator
MRRIRDLVAQYTKTVARPSEMTRNGPLTVQLDEGDWQKFLPMSEYMRMAPAALGTVLLKQALLQYQPKEHVDSGALEFASHLPAIHSLSPRETEVLRLAAQGGSNRGIGRMLQISEQTVKNHFGAILRKLGAKNRTQAVVLALRAGSR